MTTYADLKVGDRVVFEPVTGRVFVLTVVAIEPDGFEFGSDSRPMLKVTYEGMPKPFKGTESVAARNAVELAI